MLRLVKERCKLAAQKSDKEQKRELIARNSLEKQIFQVRSVKMVALY